MPFYAAKNRTLLLTVLNLEREPDDFSRSQCSSSFDAESPAALTLL